ncbi:very long chain fatty acid elongase 7-like isoform X2 [Babylonia areolata]
MENADPRVAGWFLMDSPLPSFVICLAYFIFVALGPSIMKDRKPIEMRRVLVVYNIAMVGMSTFCFVEFLLSGWLAGYTLGCQPVDYSYSPQALRMARVCWWFYFSKFIELLDTVFFIMRKKFSQVTFLHVFHHGIMPISWWFGVKLVPGGFGTFHSLLNSFIHLMMYTYYGLSALGPAFSRFLWWKKYMTSMQITQFVLVTIHSVQLLFIECNYPIFFVYWIGFYAVIFLVMFAHFYIKTYRAKDKSSAHRPAQAVANGKDKSS